MTEQERMKQGYVWQDDDENMSLQAHTKALVRNSTVCRRKIWKEEKHFFTIFSEK
ncbi:MAG: hypothetical protein ACLTS1_12240 [Coprococcus sp.]